MTNLSQKTIKKEKLSNRGSIFVWTLFDFANTSFSIVVVTFLFAVYFKETVAAGKPIGDLYWSFGTSIAMVITAFISPVLGAIADHSAGKKRFLLFFTILCIIATASLYFVGDGDILLAIILFVLANVGFEAGLVFYDAFLPELTSPKNYGRVSGYGFGMGYIGSLATLALCFPLIQKEMIKETFPLAALFFLVFSLPLFIFLKDHRTKLKGKINYFQVGFKRVFSTIKHLKSYKNLGIFLLAFFFYIEGVNTVIFFSGNYASTTLGFSIGELIVFFLIVQSTAIVGSIIFGIMADSFGQKLTIITSLIIWIVIMGFAFFTSNADSVLIQFLSGLFNSETLEMQKDTFYFVGLVAGLVMGATQSTSRSLMSTLTPPDKKTEFFGFYSFFGKSSAIIGPLVFGYISYATGSQSWAILSTTFFFVTGMLILSFVKEEKVSV
ncbi:MAG: MFS transporter [Rhodothermaceae bacterium]